MSAEFRILYTVTTKHGVVVARRESLNAALSITYALKRRFGEDAASMDLVLLRHGRVVTA